MFRSCGWLFKIQLFPWNSCWLTLHKLCCTSLCVRTNLIYDTLKQNKHPFSIHILGFIAWICLLNGKIYLTFQETRQLGRKWRLWVYLKKTPLSFSLGIPTKHILEWNLLPVYVWRHIFFWAVLAPPAHPAKICDETALFWMWGT